MTPSWLLAAHLLAAAANAALGVPLLVKAVKLAWGKDVNNAVPASFAASFCLSVAALNMLILFKEVPT